MLTAVLAVAVVGIVLLALAVVTDNTVIALLAIVAAAVGLVLLAREWLSERRRPDGDVQPGADSGSNEHFSHDESLEPDMFEPDVAYEEGDEAEDADDDADAGRDSGST